MAKHTFYLTGEYIELNNLLKILSIAPSGGAAKLMVAEGLVKVNGQTELRKTCKIRAGQVVTVHDEEVQVLEPAAE